MKTKKTKDFDDTVENLVKSLVEMSKTQKKTGYDTDKWLETLYNHYSERFNEDNNKIWTTASIFIPTSLAGFVAYTTIENPSILQIFVLMTGSLALLTIWLFIAENHRAFQDKSLAWIVAIERVIGVRDTPNSKITISRLTKFLTRSFGVQKAYAFLILAVLIVWVTILISKISCRFWLGLF